MNKKQKIVFTNYKSCIFIVKTVKKHTGNTFPKTLVLISKNKIQRKSKCAICLTEIEKKYDLKSKIKVYPKFFTEWCYKRT